MSQDKTGNPQLDSYELSEKIQAWNDGTARNITFILTEDCQLRCKYCYLCGKNSVSKMTIVTLCCSPPLN